MATASTLISAVATHTSDEAMVNGSTTWAAESTRPTSMFQSGLALLLIAVELKELRQLHSSLEVDPADRHDTNPNKCLPALLWRIACGAWCLIQRYLVLALKCPSF